MPGGKKVPSGFGRLRPVVSKLKQEPFIKRTSIMNTDIKQAMHVEAGKSFGTAEANENERHWNDDKIERKNQDPTNHYDKSRMRLNFEIGPPGKLSADSRNWNPTSETSQNVWNSCVVNVRLFRRVLTNCQTSWQDLFRVHGAGMSFW